MASLGWETADADAHALILALPDEAGGDVPMLIVGDQSILNADLGKFTGQAEPGIAVFNAAGDAFAVLTAGDSGTGEFGLRFSPAADEDVPS